MKPSSAATRLHRLQVIAITVLAVTISAVAAWRTLRVIAQLPQFRSLGFSAAQLERSMRDSLAAAPREAVDGFRMALAAQRLTRAIRQTPTAEDAAFINEQAGQAQNSQLGRLLQATIRLRIVEAAQPDAAQWWPILAPYLQGLERAPFAHFQAPLTAAWAAAYRGLRVEPGSAIMFAESQVGHALGPFLQYFVARLEQVERAMSQGDADAASVLRVVPQRLLQQWTIEPGPPALRLLAGELLAGLLKRDPHPDSERMIAALNQWRGAYLAEARRRPPPLLSLGDELSRAPNEHQRLLGSLAWLAYALGAWLSAGVVGALCIWVAVATPPGGSIRSPMVAGLITAAAALAGSGATFLLFPTLAAEDLRGDFSSLVYSWKAPLIGAGLTLILLLASSLRGPRGGLAWASRLGLLSVTAMTWLALALIVATMAAQSARRAHEQAYAAASAAPFAAIAGREAERLLDPLRESP